MHNYQTAKILLEIIWGVAVLIFLGLAIQSTVKCFVKIPVEESEK